MNRQCDDLRSLSPEGDETQPVVKPPEPRERFTSPVGRRCPRSHGGHAVTGLTKKERMDLPRGC